MSSAPPTPSEGSPSIVSRKVGAGIQARLAKLQGASGAPVVAREVPRKFPNGYDDPFKERLDGTLRRSLSGTWSVHGLEADASAASTDGSHTLVDSLSNIPLATVSETTELKRRRDFTKNWEQQQQAVADQLLSPEPSRILPSPQPIIEEPEPEEEPPAKPEPVRVVKPEPPVVKPEPPVVKPEPVVEPEKKDPDHGILTPPISEPELRPRKSEPKPVARPPTTPSSRLKPGPRPSQSPASVTASRTPIRRARASAPPSSTLAPPPVPRLHLTPSPPKTAKPTSLTAPRPHTSMSARRTSAPEQRRTFSSKVPEKVLPPPVRPRAISKVYEGPTVASLAKQRPSVSLRGTQSRAVSRADFS